MPRFFTHYWRNDTAKYLSDSEGEPLNHTAGNEFTARGVKPGDFIYIVTNRKGQLYIISKLEVAKVCDQAEAEQELKSDTLWEASDHIIASAATPMTFNLGIPVDVTKSLRFVSGNTTKPLVFKTPGHLDIQTLRGFRELSAASASDLDKFLPPMQQLNENVSPTFSEEDFFPNEIPDTEVYFEGSGKTVVVNIYERNPAARKACIQHYGLDCAVCGFNFESAYGVMGRGYIHVHHIVPLSQIGGKYQLDPMSCDPQTGQV